MTLRVDWYLYRVFTINIKGARAILVKKSDLPGFDQKHYNTTYSDLSKNTTIRLISQKAQEGYVLTRMLDGRFEPWMSTYTHPWLEL